MSGSAQRSLVWSIRERLPPPARRAARKVADLLLSAVVGSVNGARTDAAVVALTFDDGPDPVATPGILDVLAAHGVRATFFVLVDRAESHPDLVARLVDEGHEVGLHGLDHSPLTTKRGREIGDCLRRGRSRLETLTRRPVTLFRPPFGSQSLRSYAATRRAGLRVVVWGPHAEDWADRSPEQVAATALGATGPGDILLLHDGFAPHPDDPQSVPALDKAAALDILLGGLESKGYQSTTVSGLLAGRRVARIAWFRP